MFSGTVVRSVVSEIWIILAVAILSSPVCVLICLEGGQHGFQDIAEQCAHRATENSELTYGGQHGGLYESVAPAGRPASLHSSTPRLKDQPTPLRI